MGAIAPAGSRPVHPHPLLPVHAANSPHLISQLDLLALLKSPRPLPTLKLLHAHIIKTGLSRNDLVFGQLFLCCSLSNAMYLARRIFDAIPGPKLFFYNAMLKGYSENGAHLDALRLYALMRARSVRCDSFTFPAVLRSSSTLGDAGVGREVHGLALKMGCGSMLIVQTALMDAYCSRGLAAHARRVFDRIADKDVICWNTMLAGCVKCGECASAKELFDEMPTRNISSWNTIVDMYCKNGDVQTARNLFDEMPDRDLISWNAMISGCANVGDVEAARNLFNLMPKRNVVSWNVMISCYVHSRRFNEALGLFRMMQISENKPDEVTIVAILPACAHLGALDMGQWIHAYVGRHRIKMDVYVTTALVDMYGKCGSVEEATRAFEAAEEKDKDSYLCGTMIGVFAMHGRAEEAFGIFEFMRRARIKPTDVTFVGLLKACTHAGLVDSGRKFLRMMKVEFGLDPKAEHFGCFVDLLGRAGLLDEALQLIENMPMEPHPIVWASLLSACRFHGDVHLAEKVALRLIELEPESCANYVLLSNIYAKAGRWDDVASVRKTMKMKGVVKKPGCSSIEFDNSVHEFFAGDRSHPDCNMVYKMLDEMVTRLKKEGYVPKTSSVLHDVDDEGQERTVIHHSEKLTVAFGLISTAGTGKPLRIVKNLRVCDDCHGFLKLASKCYCRDIIVRDCNRFHHFVDGCCSCSDYW